MSLEIFLWLFLFLPRTVSKDQWNESIFRIAFDFAAAAYSRTPELCVGKDPKARVVFKETLTCDKLHNECWYYVALTSELIVVAFRGTATASQLILEIIESMAEPKKKFVAGGAIQHYFETALRMLWPSLTVQLNLITEDYPDHSIVFTGHSLGGAIASVASIKYAWTRFGNSTLSDIILITFGQPRVGNMDFAVAHDRLIPHSFRIVHRYDLVAHLPFCYETLRSHSCMSLRNHGPYHHGTEIWYPNDMTNISLYRICTSLPRNEDDTCSNSQYAHFNIDDHTFYYNEHVSEYGKRGCLPIRDRHRYHTDVIEKYHIDYVVLYP